MKIFAFGVWQSALVLWVILHPYIKIPSNWETDLLSMGSSVFKFLMVLTSKCLVFLVVLLRFSGFLKYNFVWQLNTVAKTAGMHHSEWVENADRWVSGFLEKFEERCHVMVMLFHLFLILHNCYPWSSANTDRWN